MRRSSLFAMLHASLLLFGCSSSGSVAGSTSCPTEEPPQNYGGRPADPCDLPDGTTCAYGARGCGGRRATCTGGRWDVVHDDPGPSCFDTGVVTDTRVEPTPDARSDIDGAEADARETDGSCPTTPPRQYYDGTPGDPCSLPEGTTCNYGYDKPGCGGISATCRGGRWDVVHTDPSAACFDAGSDTSAG